VDRDIGRFTAAILNDAWMVRHYGLERNESQRLLRAQAIKKLGLTIREAFAATDNFEPLLAAICDGLRPRDEKPF
jgi:hypothetical protein